jgi:hypothetical protein
LKNIYGPRRALAPEQTAVKLIANPRARVEWDILQTIEWIMDEINWHVIDNRLKDEVRSLHDQG